MAYQWKVAVFLSPISRFVILSDSEGSYTSDRYATDKEVAAAVESGSFLSPISRFVIPSDSEGSYTSERSASDRYTPNKIIKLEPQ